MPSAARPRPGGATPRPTTASSLLPGPVPGLRLWKADDGRQEPAQTPRRQSAERVDRDFRVGSRAAEPEIGHEEALRTAERCTDDRNLAGQRIQCIGRRDGAVQLYSVAPGIDP